MLEYLPHTKIDKARWDQCIDQAEKGLIYAYSWYLDAMAPGWDALVSPDYSLVFPLPWNQKIPFFKQVYHPFFSQQLGAFYQGQQPEIPTTALLNAIPKRFKRVQLNLHAGHSPTEQPGWHWTARTNLLLDLRIGYDQLFESYNRSTRRYSKRGREMHHFVEAPLSPEALVDLYRSHQGHKVDCPDAAYQQFTLLMQEAIRRKKGFIAGATNLEGDLTVAGFFLQSHGRIYNVFGSSNEQGRQMRSMLFLLDALIRRYAGTTTIFDFEGSSIPSIAHFFEGFGAVQEPFYTVSRGGFPNWLNPLKKLYTKLRPR